MSDQPYVSEFLAVIRHPVHEADKENTFHATITTWRPNLLGENKPNVEGPFTPADLVKMGYDLPTILGEVLSAALLERDAALATAATERSKRVKAEEERADAVLARDEAVKKVSLVTSKANAAIAEAQELTKRAQAETASAIQSAASRENVLRAELIEARKTTPNKA